MTGPVVQINTKADWYGGEYQVLKLVEGLGARGCSTLLLAHGAGLLYRRAREAGLATLPLPPIVCERWYPAGSLVVRRLLSGREPLLFHVHDSRALRLAPRVRRPRRVPVVLSRRVPSPFRGSWLGRWRYGPSRVDAIVAVSDAVRRVLVSSGVPAARIRVVASGTDIRDLDAAPPDPRLAVTDGGRLCVGGVGELSHKKNWAMLIRVAAETRRRGLDLRWVIAGDGPERPRLEALARRLNVADAVQLFGFVDNAESFTKALDILFHASRAEGTPGAVRMAMAAGVPVAAVNTPGTLETIGAFGLTFALDDDAAAAGAVERLVRDRALRDRIASDARAYARQRFDIAATVAGTLQVYEAVLGRKLPWRPIHP